MMFRPVILVKMGKTTVIHQGQIAMFGSFLHIHHIQSKGYGRFCVVQMSFSLSVSQFGCLIPKISPKNTSSNPEKKLYVQSPQTCFLRKHNLTHPTQNISSSTIFGYIGCRMAVGRKYWQTYSSDLILTQ